MAVILYQKPGSLGLRKKLVLGPGTELLYVLIRGVYIKVIHKVLIAGKGVSRVKEEIKRRIRMKEGDQRPFSTHKKSKARTLEGLWAIKHGVCQSRIVQEGSALLAS